MRKSRIAGLVRETGLEPVWYEPHAPQTCASASSATPAKSYILMQRFILYHKRNSLSTQKYAQINLGFQVL